MAKISDEDGHPNATARGWDLQKREPAQTHFILVYLEGQYSIALRF